MGLSAEVIVLAIIAALALIGIHQERRLCRLEAASDVQGVIVEGHLYQHDREYQ